MLFCPEHAKGDQNLKFTPLTEMPPHPPPWDGSRIAGISVRNERWIIVLEVIIGAY